MSEIAERFDNLIAAIDRVAEQLTGEYRVALLDAAIEIRRAAMDCEIDVLDPLQRRAMIFGIAIAQTGVHRELDDQLINLPILVALRALEDDEKEVPR